MLLNSYRLVTHLLLFSLSNVLVWCIQGALGWRAAFGTSRGARNVLGIVFDIGLASTDSCGRATLRQSAGSIVQKSQTEGRMCMSARYGLGVLSQCCDTLQMIFEPSQS